MSIKIEQLLPLLKKGWVAMDEDGSWQWFCSEPGIGFGSWGYDKRSCVLCCPHAMSRAYYCFDIEPVEDWTQSLMECGE